jgi:hypothetical protein
MLKVPNTATAKAIAVMRYVAVALHIVEFSWPEKGALLKVVTQDVGKPQVPIVWNED